MHKLLTQLFQVLVSIFFKLLFVFKTDHNLPNSLKKAAELYSDDGFGKLFAKIRAWDAPYAEVEKILPKTGKILDLGSGDGLMVNYLALSSAKRRLFGIELNKQRVEKAYKGLKNTNFKYGNILQLKDYSADAVLLIHVLHHLPSRKNQEQLITKISKSLRKGKMLVILEIEEKPFHKLVFSWLTDAITVPILFEGKFFTIKFFYRRVQEWINLLEQNNFQVTTKMVHKHMPFSHVLIKAVKK